MQHSTSLSAEQIKQRMAEMVERYGKWTSHRIQLHEGIYTINTDERHDIHAIRRTLQIVLDNAPAPMENLRILDLGCLEGAYSIEMALHGAEVVGIEGRAINIEKARFAQEALGLKNVEFIQDDARNLGVEKYGQFDIVLCLGILYHLDFPDIFHFMRNVFEVCKHFTVIDTLTSLFDRTSLACEGHTYWGQRWNEFNPTDTEEERDKAAWSSLGNMTSFCLTQHSLYNLLKHVGFTSVYECHIPTDLSNYQDRLALLARKGNLVPLRTQPDLKDLPISDWPEKDERDIGAPFNKVEDDAQPRSPGWNPLRRLRSPRK